MGKSKRNKQLFDKDIDKLIYWMNYSNFTLKEINKKFPNISKTKIRNRIDIVKNSNHEFPKLNLNKEVTICDKLYNHFKINAFDINSFCSHRRKERVTIMLRFRYIYKLPIDIIKNILFMEFGGDYIMNNIRINIGHNKFLVYFYENIEDDEIGGEKNLGTLTYVFTNKNKIEFSDKEYKIYIDKEDNTLSKWFDDTIDIDCDKQSYEIIKKVYLNTEMGSVRSDIIKNKQFGYYFDIIERSYGIEDELFCFKIKSKTNLRYFKHIKVYMYDGNSFYNIPITGIPEEEFKIYVARAYMSGITVYIKIELIADKRYFGVKNIKLYSTPIKPNFSDKYIKF